MGRMVVGVLTGTGEGDVDARRHGLEVGAVGLRFCVRASRWGSNRSRSKRSGSIFARGCYRPTRTLVQGRLSSSDDTETMSVDN